MKNYNNDIDMLVKVFQRRVQTRRDPVELAKRHWIGTLLYTLSKLPLKITLWYMVWSVMGSWWFNGSEVPWERIGFLFAGSIMVRAAFSVSGNKWAMSIDERLVCMRWRYFKRDLECIHLWDVLKGCESLDDLEKRVLNYFSDMSGRIADISLQTSYGADSFVLLEHCYNRRRAYAEALLGVSVPQLARFEVDGKRVLFTITIFPKT